MDSKNSRSLLVQDIDPKGGHNEIDEGEQEVNPRKNCFTSREIIAAVGSASFQIVHRGADVHGDLELREAIGEDESVLIGGGLGVGEIEGGGGGVGELIEGEDALDGVGLEDAIDLRIVDLLEDVRPGVDGAEEESELGELGRVGCGAGEGEVGDVELELAAVGEAELVEED